jgi:type I restriction enzyme S subunit
MTGPYIKPYLRVANVLDGYIDYSDVLEMNFTPYEAQIYELRRGDVLLNEGQALDLVGRCAIFDGPSGICFQNTLLRFRPREVLPGFAVAIFKHWLHRGEFRKLSRQTTSIAHLGISQFSAMRFPLAPIKEQQRITRILDAVDDQISCESRALAKHERLGQAIAGSLIPIGQEPRHLGQGWELAKLAEVVPSAEYGISTPLGSAEGGLPVLRMNNLSAGKMRLNDIKTSTEPVPAHLLLKDRDVLFNRTNSYEHVGRTSIWRSELSTATFASYLVRLNPDKTSITPEYLTRWLNMPAIQQRIRRIATHAVHQVNINPTNLRELSIELPREISHQQSITAALDECDHTVEQAKVNLVKLRMLKQGLMDDLLTGRVRVPVEAAPGA